MTAATLSYRRIEAGFGPWRSAGWAASFGCLAIAVVHVIVPRLPRAAIDVMEVGFRLEGMGGVLLVNDYLVVYGLAFFVGVAALLQVVLAPREEHRLELLLSKPVRPGEFVAARSWPIIAAATGIGVITSVGCGVAIVPWLTGAESISFAGTVGAGLLLTAVAVVQLAILDVVFVRIRDGFEALLVACATWFVPMVPTAVFMYRPDLFDGHETVRNVTVLATLVWSDAAVAWIGPLALVAAFPIAAGLVRVAGVLLARTDAA